MGNGWLSAAGPACPASCCTRFCPLHHFPGCPDSQAPSLCLPARPCRHWQVVEHSVHSRGNSGSPRAASWEGILGAALSHPNLVQLYRASTVQLLGRPATPQHQHSNSSSLNSPNNQAQQRASLGAAEAGAAPASLPASAPALARQESAAAAEAGLRMATSAGEGQPAGTAALRSSSGGQAVAAGWPEQGALFETWLILEVRPGWSCLRNECVIGGACSAAGLESNLRHASAPFSAGLDCAHP